MKKTKMLIIGLILLFISTMFAEDITLYSITPSILLPWVVYISIFLDYRYCLSYTFFLALANDLLNPQLLGFTTMLYVLLAHLTYNYHNSFNKNKVTTVVLSMLFINVVFYGIQWFYFSFSSPEPMYLLTKALITTGYNTVLSCVILVLIIVVDKMKIVFYD